MVLSETPEGITGYTLQESYNFPRTTVVRRLEKLAEKEFVAISEKVEDNRSQKIFLITEKGKEYLEEMKKKWASEFMSFNDMMPPEMMDQVGFRRPLRRIMTDDLDHLATKEDCTDFLGGVRSRIKRRMHRLERHAEATKEFKEQLDGLIRDVEQMEDYSPDKVRDKIHEVLHQVPDED